jgi:pimeloyl-ACP methyl ester carboxylesterase
MRRRGVRRIRIARHSAWEIGPVDAPVEIVFLHANGFHGALYVDVLRPLAVDRRILAPDLRGHGRTTLPTTLKLTSLDPFADDLVRLLDAIDRPVVLAGHSLGGAVSVLAAARAPKRVRALALVEPVISPPGPRTPGDPEVQRSIPISEAAAGRRNMFASPDAAFDGYHGRGPFKTWPDWALRAYVDEGLVEAEAGGFVLRCDPAWEASIYLAFGSDIWGALGETRMPLVVRAGEIYSTFPPASERKLRALRPDADIQRIPGATHFLPLEQPDVVREALELALGPERKKAKDAASAAQQPKRASAPRKARSKIAPGRPPPRPATA